MQEGRYLQSDALLDSIEHDISATRESLRSTAAEILGQARGEVARARADGIPVDAADQMLKDAETSYSEARYGDTIYAGKACISEVEELAQANADSKRQSVAEATRIKLERMEGIHRRMEVVRSDITDLVAQNLDLAREATTLSAAEQAIERGSLDEADHLDEVHRGQEVDRRPAEGRHRHHGGGGRAPSRGAGPGETELRRRRRDPHDARCDREGANGRTHRGREESDRSGGTQDQGRPGEGHPDRRSGGLAGHRGGAPRARGVRGRGRACPSRGAENRRRPQDLLGTGDRIPSEGAGRRPCADRRDPEDDRGPVPGRHLDPRRG